MIPECVVHLMANFTGVKENHSSQCIPLVANLTVRLGIARF